MALLLSLGLLVAGGVTTVLGLVRPAWDVHAARDWVQAPVLSSKTQLHPFHGVNYVRFEYEYQVRDQKFSGQRYAFTHPLRYLSSDVLLALQHRRFQTCYVNPQDPRQAVLERTLPWSAYRYSGLGLLAVGGIAPLWWLRFRKRRAFPSRLASGFLQLLGMVILAWGLNGVFLEHAAVRRLPALGAVIAGALCLLSLRPLALRVLAMALSILGPLIALIGSLVAPMENGLDAIHDPEHALETSLGWLSIGCLSWLLALLVCATAAARSGASGDPGA